MSSRELHWNLGGQDQTVRIEESRGQGTFNISGRSIPFRLLGDNRIEVAGRIHRFYVVRDRKSCTVWLDGRTYHVDRLERGMPAQSTADRSGNITALMPGKILRLEVAVGDTVVEKQTVAVMESMKMESALQTAKAGRIVEIRRQPGEIVEMGEVLMIVE